MRAPDFWYPQNNNTASSSTWVSVSIRLLRPLSFLYEMLGRARQKYAPSQRVDIPVVCIGNLTAGGTGKTPIAIALGKALKDKDRMPFFLTCGHGGHMDGPVLVDSNLHDCRDVGDEALMLASYASTIVSKNRAEGAVLAGRLGADVIIMDDGYQNPSLKKDFSILIVDADLGFGNGLIIPAGPLREHIEEGIQRADQIIVTRRQQALPTSSVSRSLGSEKVINVRLDCEKINQGNNRLAVAFAGISQVEKFFAVVRKQNYEIVGTQTFPDHHNYTKKEFGVLLAWSRERRAVLVTTEKDAYRLSPTQKSHIEVVPLHVYFDRPEDLKALVSKIMSIPP